MRLPARRAVLAVPILLGCLVVPSEAATVRCPMLTDPVGDGSNGAGDIVAVNISSDARTLTATVRLASLAASPPAPAGHVYYINLDDGEAGLEFVAQIDGLEPAFTLRRGRAPRGTGAYAAGEVLGQVKGRIDVARNEVSMTAPMSIVPWKPGHRGDLSAVAWISVGTPGSGPVARDSLIASSDFSDDTVSYRVGQRGCS